MKHSLCFTIAGIAIVNLFCVASAYLVDDNPYRHFVTLDQDGKFQLEWMVDWYQKRVIFNVTVATKGYVGLGLAKRGKMAGADIVIGGVKNSKPYFNDRYAIANQLPEVDPSQDWTLHNAWEKGGETFLSFSRPFDTCDKDHDIPITDDVTTLIWAYSEVDDQLQYHFQTRGAYDVYLLDPDLTPRSIDPNIQKGKYWKKNSRSDMSVFRMTKKMVLPTQDTVYWCSFHKVPTNTKQHIIGWNTVFPTEKDRNHVHHLLLHRCNAPEGIDPDFMFDGPSRSGGSECYFMDAPNPLPTRYCRETIHVWGVNGRAIFFPEHAGLPMSESGSEYYVLQVHYDNPNVIPNLNVTVSLDAYFTDNLRENDVGMLQLGEQIPGSTSIIIPPSSLDHVIIGHCASGCTERMLPAGGVNVFAAFLHTHISGRGVRLLHHRGNEELPWLLADDNYNFNFQQFRILRQERKLLPGDRLMQRCVYDTTERNGSVVVGGFSTREEMCTALAYYYVKSPGYALCRSEIRTQEYWDLLGIRNTTWDQSRRQVVISSPSQYAGMSITDYANNHIEWDLEMREAIQRHHLYTPQISTCPRVDIPSTRRFDDDVSDEGHGGDTGYGTGSGRSGKGGRSLQRYSLKQGRYPTIPTTPSRITYPLRKSRNQDEEDEGFISVNPKGIQRYRRPQQCTKDSRPSWMDFTAASKKRKINYN